MYIHFQSLKTAFLLGLVTFLAVLGSSYVLYSYTFTVLEKDLEEYLTGIVYTVTQRVDGDLHRTFTSRDQETSPEYLDQIAELGQVQKLFKNAKYVYTCILKDGQVYFVLDPTPPGIIENGVETKSHIMDEYEEANEMPALLDALKNQKAVFEKRPSTDRWGSFVSAYMPFYDSAGSFVGVAAVDMDSEDFAARIATIQRAELMCILIGLLVSSLFAFIHYKQTLKRIQVTDTLKHSEERFTLAIEGTNDGIWDWPDINKDEEYWSVQFKNLLGYAENEIVASYSQFLAMLHPDDMNPLKLMLTDHFEKYTPFNIEFRLKKKSGEYCWFRAKASTVRDSEGKPVRMVGSIRDITQRKSSEERLREYASQMEKKSEELAIAKEQAEEATRLKSEFLANMSHEIRTPMNGVIGMTNLLMETPLDAIQKTYVQTAINSAENLLQLVNDILDFSKIEAGKLEFEIIPFDLQSLVEEMTDLVAVKAQEKGLEMLLRFVPDMPRYVMGDPGRVRQVFLNLASNAIKFTESGYVLVGVDVKENKDGWVTFNGYIEDTGIGIPHDKQDYVFNKFSQADGSTTRKFGGTGLGLAICKELTLMMGGDIGVESTLGVGSKFWFTFRLALDTAAPKYERIDFSTDVSGVKIIVIDDNKVAQEIAAEQLRKQKVDVVLASSAEDGLEIMKSSAEKGSPFEIAILDYMMPGMDGLELAKTIKQDKTIKDVSLLMVSSAPSRGDSQRMEEIGFSGYLTKPISGNDIAMAVTAIKSMRDGKAGLSMITRHMLREINTRKESAEAQNESFEGAQILLAEDNPTNQMVATTMLEKMGCHVTPAGNGHEVVRLIKQRHFDLIFMDCEMPEMDGFEATRTIRVLEKRESFEKTPIVAFTAHAIKGDDQKCYAAGMDDYITKPIKKQAMITVLNKWLSAASSLKKASQKEDSPEHHSQTMLIDMSTLKDMQDLMDDKFKPMVEDYLTNSVKYISRAIDAATSGQAKELAEAVHPLKSSSAALGVVQLSELAAEIERKAYQQEKQENKDLGTLSEELKSLRTVFEESERTLRKFITSIE
jgi:PAS domain S-box-containing protein